MIRIQTKIDQKKIKFADKSKKKQNCNEMQAKKYRSEIPFEFISEYVAAAVIRINFWSVNIFPPPRT